MKPHARRVLRGTLEAACVLMVIALIAYLLIGCTALRGNGEEPISSGHNTTLPPMPTCLVFCFATVHSTVETTTTSVRRARPPKPASAPAVSAPKATSTAKPASAPRPASAPPEVPRASP